MWYELFITAFGIKSGIPSMRNLLSTVAKFITPAQSSVLTLKNPVTCDVTLSLLTYTLSFLLKQGQLNLGYFQHASSVYNLENFLLVLKFLEG